MTHDGHEIVLDGNLHTMKELETAIAPHHRGMLISDVVHLSWTYLILLIKIRLYLCRLDYILSIFLLYLPIGISLLSFFIRTLYCSFLIVLSFCTKNNRWSRLTF